MAKEELLGMIARWKQERQAVILAHNYQLGEVQDLADFVGDSLELSRQAARTEAPVIVFCGVRFMAETASILSPQKVVLHPDPSAGCPLANMINAEQLRALKAEHPGRPVVCYVNSSAEVKAESDLCCTSANAVAVVNAAPGEEVIFVPDRNLGAWVAGQTGKRLIIWDGYCPTHERIMPEQIEQLRDRHPEAVVMVHPECRPAVVALADEVLSTGGMLRFARISPAQELIVGTELGLIHRLEQENPGKRCYPVSRLTTCPNMKRITLEKVLWSLEDMKDQVVVPEPVRSRARRAIERMVEIG
jgi:quinolinate synthase